MHNESAHFVFLPTTTDPWAKFTIPISEVVSNIMFAIVAIHRLFRGRLPLLLRGLFVYAWATSAVAGSLDFEAMVLVAERGDPQIANASISKESARNRLDQARRFVTPNALLVLGSQSNSFSMRGIPDLPPNRQSFISNNATLSVTQSLYNPLRAFNIEDAKLQAEFEAVQMLVTRNELALKLFQTLVELSGAISMGESLQADVNAIRNLVEEFNDPSRELELSHYRVRLVQTEGQAKLSRNLRLQRQRDLVRLGFVGTAHNSPRLRVTSADTEPQELPSLEDLLAAAQLGNLQLRLQEVSVQLAVAAFNRTSRDRYPTVDLVANRAINRGGALLPKMQAEATLLGLQINLPIGDGGMGSVLRTEAISQKSRARNDLEAQRKFVQQTVSDTYFEHINNAAQIDTENQVVGIYAQKKVPPPLEGEEVDAYFAASQALEERLAKSHSMREIGRLQRDLLLSRARLWASAGPLESSHFRAISAYFH
jgi:outer membrane protein TolC